MSVQIKKMVENPVAVTMKRAFFAQACGDAFCYHYEFCPPKALEEVQERYESIKLIGITDDTQMALFGLYGLHEASRLGVSDINTVVKDHVLQAYLDWYETQGGGAFRRQTVLTRAAALHVPRAPGNTCMASLGEIYRTGTRGKNGSKGNGGVMRALPFVFAGDIIPGLSEADGYAIGVAASQLTHDHMDSTVATYAFMRLCTLLLEHQLEDPVKILESFYWAFPTVRPIANNVEIICKSSNTFTAIPALQAAIVAFIGGAYYTQETGFSLMMQTIAVAGGDADTIAAMAGALWGCWGYSAPQSLIVRLLERSIIERMINHLF